MPGAEALEYPDRLPYRKLRRDFEGDMGVIYIYLDRVSRHVMPFGSPPQQPFAIPALFRQPQRSSAALGAENQMVPTIPNGVTTTTEHVAPYTIAPRPPPTSSE